MMAEGNDTTGGETGGGDLLSERRARRAAESGELALTRRAEAAEATVLTLERHVASLQQRLGEAEQERLRIVELLEAEKGAALEREHELRRVKQREYAEQQLRVEAEDRLAGLDRETRAESERIARRLSSSEEDARELAERLEDLQRQLAEAEQAAAADRAQISRAEQELQARLADLEARAGTMQQGLEAEHAARERTESELLAMRQGHGQMERLVAEIKTIVERATRAALRPQPAAALAEQPAAPAGVSKGQQLAAPESTEETRGAEMAEALAAAVERLRARADAAVPEQAPAARKVPELPRYKHSLSLVGRLRIRRKQRRSR
jgi:hypothetical protein